MIPSVAAPEAQDAEPRDQSVRAEADDSTAIDAIAAVKGTGPSGGSPQFIPLVAGKDVEDADPLDWSAREEAEDDDEAFATDPLDPWTPYEAAEDTTIIAAIAALKDAIAQLRARGYTDRQIIVEGSLDPQDASAASTDLPYELNAVAPQGAPPRLTGEPSRAVSVSAQLDLPMDSGPRVTDKPSPAAEASSSEPPIVLQTDWAASHGLATQIIEINYAAQKKES